MKTYVHVFYSEDDPKGWYYAFGVEPTCLPESDPVGPFFTEGHAENAARETMNEQGYAEAGSLEFYSEGEDEMFPDDEVRPFDANKLDCPLTD